MSRGWICPSGNDAAIYESRANAGRDGRVFGSPLDGHPTPDDETPLIPSKRF